MYVYKVDINSVKRLHKSKRHFSSKKRRAVLTSKKVIALTKQNKKFLESIGFRLYQK